jgi:pimeloyl-ACP methyl ester carboxylesterase
MSMAGATMPDNLFRHRETVMTHVLRMALVVWLVQPLAAAHAQDKFFTSDGVRIRYIDQGAGTPVVLVHGLTANVELNWMETGIMQSLAKEYRVIALDCRGHGKSDKPHDPKDYGPAMGQDVIRLLDHLNIRRAHIIGYSMGARIIGQLVTTNANRFYTATLGASPPHRNWTVEDERRFQELADRFENGNVNQLIGPNYEGLVSDRQVRAARAYFDGKALAALVRSSGRQQVPDALLSEVAVPTLAIVGTADSRLEGMRDLKRIMPSLTIVELKDATHVSACFRPEFIETVREFIFTHETD